MLRPQAQRIEAFFDKQEGPSGTFEYYFPGREPLGILGGKPKVGASALAGVSTVSTRGWGAGRRVLRNGDFVRFQHTKVYRVIGDVRANGNGKADIVIRPGLRQTIHDGDGLIVSGFTFRMSFVAWALPTDIRPPYLCEINFSLLERY